MGNAGAISHELRIAGKILCLAILLWVGQLAAFAGTQLQLEFEPRFGNQALSFGFKCYPIGSGQEVSITRLDFLVSDLQLRDEGGQWVTAGNQVSYISGAIGRTRFSVEGLPAGHYDRIRFHIGLDSEQNARSPSDYPAEHPLNPEVNHLYWGWRGGYVFLALEGHWREPGKIDTPSGFSWHLATEQELMTVELPIKLQLANSQQIRLPLNLERIFAQPNRITLNDVSQSTHSRPNDSIARKLRQNIEQAFAVQSITAIQEQSAQKTAPKRVLIGPTATPYQFRFSRFFPRPSLPDDNPLTEEGVALGRKLFFEKRLSINNSQSCGSCHNPARAFSQDTAVSTGAEGVHGRRNAMALFNLAWKSTFFWDGRASSLREQVLQPIQERSEMHETVSNVVAKLSRKADGPTRGETDYESMFAQAFGSPQITDDRIARALEQFLLAQTSFDSKFDQVLKGKASFTPEEQRGFELFNTEYDPRRNQFGADCFHCHGGPLFRSQDFANNGLAPSASDEGRYEVTRKEGDRGKFAVPSLRNVELTGPYMHDGRFATLKEAVEHYRSGVVHSATLNPNLAKHPGSGLPLTDTDVDALIAFLKTLTENSLRGNSPVPLNSADAGSSRLSVVSSR